MIWNAVLKFQRLWFTGQNHNFTDKIFLEAKEWEPLEFSAKQELPRGHIVMFFGDLEQERTMLA